MKIFPKNLSEKISKNQGIFYILLLIITSIFITQIFQLSKNQSNKEYVKLLNNIYFKKTIENLFQDFQPKYKSFEHRVEYNETINSILKKYNIPSNEINLINKKINNDKEVKSLKVNDLVKFKVDNTDKKVVEFIIPISKTKKVKLIRDLAKNSFERTDIITNLQRKIVFREAKIKQSLYRSATKQKIPPNVIIEFARIYGFQVDFQRDIRKNDSFQIIYEVFVDENKKVFNTGNILFADLNLSNQNNALYFFNKKGNQGHYDLNGKSAKKALMKTPINGARLSSPFGMRKHPIDGFNKMHRGTDFAAPEGTPIMASGDGVIIKASWCGGGGNCVKIKHNSTYSTVYAHLSKFSGVSKVGNRVKQGQVIGYVGSTGKSTGPHLHYEVIFNGKRINSQTLKLPSGKILKGTTREEFEIAKIKTDVLKSELILKYN
tara:strand:+ start:257 stop:1558 length:1302 start_codon:yes stop_codon:yes gene_type:complete